MDPAVWGGVFYPWQACHKIPETVLDLKHMRSCFLDRDAGFADAPGKGSGFVGSVFFSSSFFSSSFGFSVSVGGAASALFRFVESGTCAYAVTEKAVIIVITAIKENSILILFFIVFLQFSL